MMAANGLGYPISIEGAVKYWREEILVQRRLYPEITASVVIAWRRHIPYSQAVNKMIEEINAFRHKCEYDISIGHDKMIDYRIDVQDQKISCTSIFRMGTNNYGKKISGIF